MSQGRKFIRFKGDPKAIAMIGLPKKEAQAAVTLVALVVNESFTGCRLAFLALDQFKMDQLKPQDRVWIRVGKLDPLKAEVKWKKTINDSLCEAGFEYISNEKK